jgi:hypothetical protein
LAISYTPPIRVPGKLLGLPPTPLAAIVIVNGALLSAIPFVSVTVKTIPVKAPATVGVPLITPVLVLSEVPVVSVPEEIEYVYGAVPPDVEGVAPVYKVP